MIIYFVDRSMNVLGSAGTNVDAGYRIIDDDKEEDVENGSAIFEFKFIYDDKLEADAKALIEAGNYIFLKRDGNDECYTILYNELDRAERSIEVYCEDAGLSLINEISPKFSHYSAFDDALASYGLDPYTPTQGSNSGKWEVANYNTGEDEIIDVNSLAARVYGNGETAEARNWYIHVAYGNMNSNNAITDFSTTDNKSKTYFGVYRDQSSTSSTSSSDYNWYKAATNGLTSNYSLFVAYCDRSSSGNISNFSTSTQANDFRGYVGGALAASTVSSTSTTTTSSNGGAITVGATVRIAAGAVDMNRHCKFASWVYQRDYTVLEVKGNRVVFGWSNGAITGVTDDAYIITSGTTTTTTTTTTVAGTAPTDSSKYTWVQIQNGNQNYAISATSKYTCTTGEDIGYGKHGLTSYYTSYARTYYYFSQPTLITTNYKSDDASSVYLNGELVGTNNAADPGEINVGITLYLYFNKGWNMMEIVIHQITTPNYWKFETDPASNQYCEQQNSLSDFLDAHTIAWYFNEFAGNSGFEIGTNELSDSTLSLYWNSEDSTANRLLSVANAFDAELSYTFDIEHMKLVHMYVNFWKKRGSETDIELRFGREVSNIRIKSSVENLATALYATGGNLDEQGHELTLLGYSYDDGDFYVDTDGVLKSRNALANYHRYQIGTDDGHLTKTFSYDTVVQSTLFQKALEELKKVCEPEVNYEVEIQIPPENIHIGDTVRVIDEKGGTYLRARIIKLERKICEDQMDITLGDYLIEESSISKELKQLALQFQQLQANSKRYTWYAYANSVDGEDISLLPYDIETDELTLVTTYSNFRKYVGIAYNMTSPSVVISDPSLFQWALIKGENGTPGTNGVDGKTYYFHVAYANKDDDGNWTDFSTTEADGRDYIGTYTDENEPDATVPSAYKWQLVKGKDAESSIAHIAYANKDSDGNITDFSTTDNTGRAYLGIVVTYESESPTDSSKYTWTKIVGDDGYSPEVSIEKHDGVATITVTGKDGTVTTTTISDGKDGTSIKGDDGETAYLHVAYATSSDGATDFNMSWFDGATYLGVLSDHTEKDSTTYTDYEWSLIKGSDGHSPSVTATKSGDSTTIYVDGTAQATINDGADGRGISSADITYGVSSSASTAPTTWVNTVPTSLTKGDWLWVKTVTTYTDNTTSTGYSKSYIGTDGEDGKSVYVLSSKKVDGVTTVVLSDGTDTSTITIEDGTDGTNGTNGKNGYVHVAWATSADGSTGFSTSVSTGKTYIGVYTDNTETDSETYSDYSWSLIKGADGKNGTSVTVSSIQYQSGASATTAPTGTWSDSVVSVAEGNYLWTKITYSDGKIAYTVSKQGKSGTNGTSVTVKSSDVTYQLSTSGTTVPTGTWSTTALAPTTTQYLWTRTIIIYSDSSTTTSYSVGGKAGTNGTAARTYLIIPSASVIKVDANGNVIPTSVTINTYYRDGNALSNTTYSGRLQIIGYRSTGSTSTVYTSSSNESSHSLTTSTAYTSYVINLYAAGGTTTLLATTAIPVMFDIENLEVGSRNLLWNSRYLSLNSEGTPEYWSKWHNVPNTREIVEDDEGIRWIHIDYTALDDFNSVTYSASDESIVSADDSSVTTGLTASYSSSTKTITFASSTSSKLALSYSDGTVNIRTASGYSGYTQDGISGKRLMLELGQVYVFSFYAYGTGEVEYFLHRRSTPAGDNGPQEHAKITVSSTVARYAVSVPADSTEGKDHFCLMIGASYGSDVYISRIKFERGNTPTDWTPAPEDVNNRIDKTIVAYTQEYYQSTSDTELSGGSWSTTLPSKVDGDYYWIRYKTTYADGSVSYDPDENGKLLTDINELWGQVTENTTSIKTTNAAVTTTASRVTSVETSVNTLSDAVATKDDLADAQNNTNANLQTIRTQIAELQVRADAITASVTDNQNAVNALKSATAQLTTDGLLVNTSGATSASNIDGSGLTVTDKTTDEVIAKFTSGQSQIQNVKITEQLQVGAHIIYGMNGTEYDGTTDLGTGFMWTGGNS